jgi:hypothetical protein
MSMDFSVFRVKEMSKTQSQRIFDQFATLGHSYVYYQLKEYFFFLIFELDEAALSELRIVDAYQEDTDYF